VGGLERRIKWLEERNGPEQCPECGQSGSEWGAGDFEVVWEDVRRLEDPSDEDQQEETEENTYCGTCGLPLEIVVTWGDDVIARPNGEV